MLMYNVHVRYVIFSSMRTLVDELVERVLAVSARFSPHDRSGRVVDPRAAARDRLAVRLHVALLEVRREPVQVLSEGRKAWST